jgi:hypothetical protein
MSRKPAESFFKFKDFKKGKPTEEVIDTKKVDDRKAEIKKK